MAWGLIFGSVSTVTALFGFGVLASAEMAQLLTAVFGLLALGCFAAPLIVRRRPSRIRSETRRR